jgi:hypothetical protein
MVEAIVVQEVQVVIEFQLSIEVIELEILPGAVDGSEIGVHHEGYFGLGGQGETYGAVATAQVKDLAQGTLRSLIQEKTGCIRHLIPSVEAGDRLEMKGSAAVMVLDLILHCSSAAPSPGFCRLVPAL